MSTLPTPPTFSDRLRHAMVEHGYGKPQRKTSQTGIDHLSLSRATGINREVLRRYLMGLSKPNSEHLEILALHLNVQPAWLSFGTRQLISHRIPILSFDTPFPTTETLLSTLEAATQFAQINCHTAAPDWFAMLIDSEHENPLFALNTALIFNPHLVPKSSNFILVSQTSDVLPVAAQLIVENDNHYLRALNLDPYLRPLAPEAIIHAVFIAADYSRGNLLSGNVL